LQDFEIEPILKDDLYLFLSRIMLAGSNEPINLTLSPEQDTRISIRYSKINKKLSMCGWLFGEMVDIIL
jgi:hypothetical protein